MHRILVIGDSHVRRARAEGSAQQVMGGLTWGAAVAWCCRGGARLRDAAAWVEGMRGFSFDVVVLMVGGNDLDRQCPSVVYVELRRLVRRLFLLFPSARLVLPDFFYRGERGYNDKVDVLHGLLRQGFEPVVRMSWSRRVFSSRRWRCEESYEYAVGRRSLGVVVQRRERETMEDGVHL